MEWWARFRERRRAAKETARRKGPKDHWLREALETVATAVIMALVVRHYAVEAFKIPTESMAPTLLGDQYGGGIGDRILVNKWPLYFRGPERWKIVVFRYPLNTSTNYVKRLVGLGGEHLRIHDGDVWIDGKIARKPRGVQDSVWKNFYPEALRDDLVADAWDLDGGAWSGSGGDFRVDATGGTRTLELGHPVTNWLNIRPNGRLIQQPGATVVGDVRVSADVTIESGDGAVEIVVVEHGAARRVRLSAGGCTLADGDREQPIAGLSIERGRTYRVAFANVDDALDLVVDGEPVARLEYDTEGRSLSDDHAVRFVARAVTARLGEVRVDRDIHYTGDGEDGRFLADIKIPEGCYVMLGDNSNNSKDSRLWEVNAFLLKDGTLLLADPTHTDPATGRSTPNFVQAIEDGGAVIRFFDVQGVRRSVRLTDLASALTHGQAGQRNAFVIQYRDGSTRIALAPSLRETETGIRFRDASGTEQEAAYEDLAVPDARFVGYAPFVRREQILGEAFFVFWPASPWRLRFLGGR